MPGPTLTEDLTGNPWVEVFFNPADLDPACARLRVYRQSEGRTWLVRGGVDIATGVAVLDFEVPFQTVATYRAEQFDVAGASLGYTLSTDITLDVEGTWIHNPLEPTGGIYVEIDDESAPDIVRPTPGELIHTEGAVLPDRIGSRRRAAEGVFVALNIDGATNITRYEEMLGTYERAQLGILCIRTSDPVMWPRTFFASSPSFLKVDKTIRYAGEWVQIRATCDEVKPPYPGLTLPLLTYDDLDVAYATYTARDASYSTYTDQDRDYALAGLA